MFVFLPLADPDDLADGATAPVGFSSETVTRMLLKQLSASAGDQSQRLRAAKSGTATPDSFRLGLFRPYFED